MAEALFEMGRYAAFVWPAYGITLVGIACAIAFTLRAYRRAKKRLASLEDGRIR
jgi:heme exporter protein CcmD